MTTSSIQAFWFCPADGVLGYGDGRKPRLRSTHDVDAPIALCNKGLHASTRLIDALKYAPGSMLYLVELSGHILSEDDKLVSTHRKYLARFNANALLKEFALKQALINISKAKRYFKTAGKYALVLRWLKTGDESLRSAARSAAWSAAESAARSAARSAAWSAANTMLTDMVRQQTGWNI